MKKKFLCLSVAVAMLMHFSAFAMSTKDFDEGMSKGIEYFNQGLYQEAKDEFIWFHYYNKDDINGGQMKYLLDYMSKVQSKIQELQKAQELSGIYKFSDVSEYEGKIYCRYNASIKGGINKNICSPLPYGLHDLGTIYSFVCYNGYIYYLTGNLSTDYVRCSIYRSDMDGTDNVLIADNVASGSNCYIVDNVLYCGVVEGNSKSEGYCNDAIAKISLLNGSYEIIYRRSNGAFNTNLCYCDKSLIYVSDYLPYPSREDRFFCIDINGNYKYSLSENNPYIINDIVYDDYSYNMYDRAIYKYDSSGKSTWLCNVPKYIDNYWFNPDLGDVKAIIDNKIYYTNLTRKILYGFNAFLIRSDMDGKNPELVGCYFQP